MGSNRGAVVLVVFCLILAVAGIVLVTGGIRAETKQPAEVAPPAPKAPAIADVRPELVNPAPKGELSPPPAPSPPTPPPPTPAPPPKEPDIELGAGSEKLIVPPVSEVEMPLDMAAGEKQGYYAAIANNGGFLYEMADAGGKSRRGIVVPGMVIVRQGLVELFGCGEGGKEHETIVRVDSDIQSLDLALTMAGFKRGKLPKVLDINHPEQGSRVIVLVQWTDENGKAVTYRSEDLLVSTRRGKPMPRVGWTYVGDWTELPDPAGPEPEPPGASGSGSSSSSRRPKVLSAAASRTLLATFRDKTALLDCPMKDAEDDTSFAANVMILPRIGTRVRVIFRHPTPEERAEIARVEKEIGNEAQKEHEHEEQKDK